MTFYIECIQQNVPPPFVLTFCFMAELSHLWSLFVDFKSYPPFPLTLNCRPQPAFISIPAACTFDNTRSLTSFTSIGEDRKKNRFKNWQRKIIWSFLHRSRGYIFEGNEFQIVLFNACKNADLRYYVALQNESNSSPLTQAFGHGNAMYHLFSVPAFVALLLFFGRVLTCSDLPILSAIATILAMTNW